MRATAVLATSLLLMACDKPAGHAVPSAAPAAARPWPTTLRARVVRTFPHDRGAFTQGLLLHDGALYESTGLPGQSSLRRVELETGRVLARVDLEAPLFGEGLALVGTRLYQLTWQDGRALVWNLETFEKEREHRYEGEGWGLCYDGRRLVMSDGSDTLVFRDPETFKETGRVSVRHGGRPLPWLNELECVDGQIYANVWQQPVIVRIDPATGETNAWVDASGLLSPEDAAGADVLNGIAHVPGTDRFLLTGKLWPRLFEVELVPR